MTNKISKELLCQMLANEGYHLVDSWQERMPSATLTKISYTCPVGHERATYLCNWRKGKRCQECHTLTKKRTPDKEIAILVEKEGGTFLETFIKNQCTYFRYICPRGHKTQSSRNTWKQGKRCRLCSFEERRLDTSLVKQFFEKEGYECLDVYLKNKATWVDYICPKNHKGSVKVSRCRAEGIRCYQCLNSGGFKDESIGILYYLAIDWNNKRYYKIGITNKTVEKRFSGIEKELITILSEKVYLFGWMAREEERKILEKYHKYRYKGSPILPNGNTEIFTKDVLNLDQCRT